jgi:hypothetical protein
MPTAKQGKKRIQGKKHKKQKSGAARGIRLEGIVPFTTSTVPQAFPKPRSAPRNRLDLRAFDATHPMHMPLPRAVGEYTTIRVTRAIKSTDKLMIFSAFQHNQSTGHDYQPCWMNTCAVGASNMTIAPSEAGWNMYDMPTMPSAFAQIAPAALTVQVMNGGSLQTTSGISYIGRSKTNLQFGGRLSPTNDLDGVTAQDIANDFVSYMAPRICSNPKLSLRGVKVDSYPLNMNQLSNFTKIDVQGVVHTGTHWPTAIDPAGFAPIVVYNESGADLSYLVTMEMRVRFDITNPASAGHVYHPATPLAVCDGLVHSAAVESGLQCVKDIAEAIAQKGATYISSRAIAALGA